jgi:molybdate transport system regulatory protein
VAIDGRDAFGPGKIRLLEAIAATRSLAEAAKKLRMSYRLAWKHLKILEERTGLTVVEPQRGGRGGGGTDLTPDGRALLTAYHKFRADVEGHVETACHTHFGRWRSGKPKATSPEQIEPT